MATADEEEEEEVVEVFVAAEAVGGCGRAFVALPGGGSTGCAAASSPLRPDNEADWMGRGSGPFAA